MLQSLLSPTTPGLKLILVGLIVWSLFWKGLSLWKAARAKQKYWFVALLLVNSLGLLEIIFLAFFQKKEQRKIV
jgi:hypothetical protein